MKGNNLYFFLKVNYKLALRQNSQSLNILKKNYDLNLSLDRDEFFSKLNIIGKK